eukprot:191068-Lingulodinium_polyedra.AAC.1
MQTVMHVVRIHVARLPKTKPTAPRRTCKVQRVNNTRRGRDRPRLRQIFIHARRNASWATH